MKHILKTAWHAFLAITLAIAIIPASALAASYTNTQTTTGSGLGLSASWDTPRCGTPTTFHLEGHGGVGPYEYYLNAVQIDDPGYFTEGSRVIDPSRTKYSPSQEIEFTFYASGTYTFMFYVMDKGATPIQTKRLIVKVTVEDPAYPHLNTVASNIAITCTAAGNKTDFQKALWLHDWILNKCTYDNSLVYCGAEGALVRGIGTCESYHRAYVMLLELVGIPTGRITGNGHVWTAVKLDGEWYQVDATWDDAQQFPGYPDVRHLYFGMDDHIAGLIHSDHTTPIKGYESTSLKQNYFVKTGEIKQWSDPYVSRIAQNIAAGKTAFTITIDHASWPANYKNALYNVVAYDLSQRAWKNSSGTKVAAQITYANDILTINVSQDKPSQNQPSQGDQNSQESNAGQPNNPDNLEPPSASITFIDVPKDHWAVDLIKNAVSAGLIQGSTNTDGTTSFRPNEKITRAETAMILCRMAGYNASKFVRNTTGCSDVEDNAWYTAALNWTSAMKIMTGSNGIMRPNDPITREELAKVLMVYSGAGLPDSKPATWQKFNSYPDSWIVSEWARPYVCWAVNAEIMGAAPTLNPCGNATRAEATKMMYMVYTK